MQKYTRTNNRIRVPEVQVIDQNGKQLGVLRTPEALALAREQELDLVEVGPHMKPPIAKIMDYGKYMYQKEKKEKKTGGRQKDQETKTVRVGFKTGDHDLRFKAKKALEFLEAGNIVRVELILRGRERALAHIGREKVDTFLKLLLEIPVKIIVPVKRSPRGWITIVQKDKNPKQHDVNEKNK